MLEIKESIKTREIERVKTGNFEQIRVLCVSMEVF